MNKTAADAISACLAVTFIGCMCWHYMTGSAQAERIFTFYGYFCSVMSIAVAFTKPDGKKKSVIKRWFHGSVTVVAIVYSVAVGWILLGSALTVGLLLTVARAMKNDEIYRKSMGDEK